MKDKILQLVKTKGPVLPAQISKEVKMDSLMASAYLSDLVSSKQILISNLKVGGSPLYYAAGQETKLQDFKNNLSEKDERAFDHLKKEKVVRDSEQTPLMRVALRTIKDFAIPLKVNKKEIFWKWYLLKDEEAYQLIKQKLEGHKPAPKKEEKKEDKKEEKKEEQKKLPDPKPVSKEKEEVKSKPEIKPANIENHKEQLDKYEKEKIKELEKMQQQLEKQEKYLLNKMKLEKERMEKEFKKREEELIKRLEAERNNDEEEKKEIKDDFLDKIKAFCEKNEIKIEDVEIIKKSKEIDLFVMIPTPVGEMKYFCKAKDKKRCNDGDLSSAYLKAQSLVLPILFLTTGDLTKQAQEMVGNVFKQMIVKKI